MSQTSQHPLEVVLLAIAAADPRPWDYQREARDAGIDPRELDGVLELLWLEGLVTRAETGPGIALTPLGRQVLEDPEARQRLRAGEAITPGQGAVVRNSLRRPITPFVTRLLLVANLAVFGYCIYLAKGNKQTLTLYLTSRSDEAVTQRVFRPAGAVSIPDVVRGDWWRLLTACFVHAGILHIAMNMYALYAAGRFVEQTWGHLRYFLIYSLSGWAGSCIGVLYLPFAPRLALDSWPVVVGASGALCGILAADGVWIYLYGKHLPRALARRGKFGFWSNVLLMTFISFLPGISGWGHLAGALMGAATAFVLHFVRFGSLPARVLGVVALVPLAWYPFHYLNDVGPRGKAWKDAEDKLFTTDVIRPMQQAMAAANTVYRETFQPLYDMHPDRREPEQVEEAVAAIDKQLDELSLLATRLGKTRWKDEEAVTARQAAIDFIRAREEVFREAKRCLMIGKDWKAPDRKQFDQLLEQQRQKHRAWEALLV